MIGVMTDRCMTYSSASAGRAPKPRGCDTCCVPALRAVGLKVPSEDFRLGEPIVLEIGRAVERSHYTVAVLTPRYLENDFLELENVLAVHLGAERHERRLVAIMREPTRPRIDLRARQWLDMTRDDEFDINVARLAYELSMPPTRGIPSGDDS